MKAATKTADTVTAFLETYFQEHQHDISTEGPQLECFEPKEDALLGSLWKPQWNNVPSRLCLGEQEGFITKLRPSLLLHGLDDANAQFSQPAAHNHIRIAQQQGPTFLYGTSGAGKTRSVFEYLSHNKGFYFLADDFERNPGSRDLLMVLDCNLSTARLNDNSTNIENRARIKHRVSMLLFVRYVVHEKLTALLGRDMTPYEWLLYQIFPDELLGGDVFYQAMAECVVKGVEAKIFFEYWAPTKEVWSIFVDEAQALLEMNKSNFLSQNGAEMRSAFSALIEGLGFLSKSREYLHYPVFSGTGLAFDQFSEQTLSVVGKSLGDSADVVFSDFNLLGVKEVQRYLRQILDLSSVRDDVLKHVANWLRGRPGWTAGFLEVYSSRREKQSYASQVWRTQGNFKDNEWKLMEALDRYLNIMTCAEEANRRESWSAGEASAYACFARVHRKIANAEESQRPLLKKVEIDLEYTVCRFAIGQKPHPFTDAAAILLIENGVAAVCETDRQGTTIKGHFDEPIVIQSGINFFDLDNHLQENLVKQEDGGLGEAFERLLLPGLLMEKKRLHEFLKSHLKDSGALALEAYDVSRRSAYGVLCVDTRGEVDRTIEWVTKSANAEFEGQVAPFCYPDIHIGPDLIFLLRNRQDYEDFRACIVQSKYVSEVTNQQDALRTLIPTKLYQESRGKPEKEKISQKLFEELSEKWDVLKDKFVSDERPCLQLLVQMPAEPTASAISGSVAADATGPKSKSKRKKRDWLVVVDGKKAEELFSEKSAGVVRLLKRPKENNGLDIVLS